MNASGSRSCSSTQATAAPSSRELNTDSGPGSIKGTETSIALIPQVGYFVSDGFEVGGLLAIVHSDFKLSGTGLTTSKTTTTTFEVGALAGYYLKLGDSMRVGPDVAVVFHSQNADFGGGRLIRADTA